MATIAPYTYYACPCRSNPTKRRLLEDSLHHTLLNGDLDAEDANEGDAGDEEQPFDPYSPRANYSLYPLEHLLFCNECHEIRCPRCYYEEALYYYCPNCLMETSATSVKGETNRCTRSCFQCPICFTTLALQSLPSSDDTVKVATSVAGAKDGPFILACPYCCWTTLDIGIKFDRSINLSAQLAKLLNKTSASSSRTHSRHQSLTLDTDFADQPDAGANSQKVGSKTASPQDRFNSLTNFYKGELTEQAPGPLGLGTSFGLESPSHLTRLLSTYGVSGLKRQRNKPQPMREAHGPSEGLILGPTAQEEAEEIVNLRLHGPDSVTDRLQRKQQQLDANAADIRSISSVRPIPTPLRSKRAKRCRSCRHNLIRPDEKRHSTRYKIRLLALNYVPRCRIRLQQSSAVATSSTASADTLRPPVLTLRRAAHFVLTFQNPLFDPITLRLATPSTAPGPRHDRVTLLCPQFEVGASTDVWDEALDAAATTVGSDPKGAVASTSRESKGEGAVPEAGKIWERGRNWTSVILEINPGAGAAISEHASNRELTPNERDVEIPILVRMEYATDVPEGDILAGKSTREARVTKELQYWMVVGLGRVEQA